LSAPVFSEIGAHPSGSFTLVPEALMRAISSGENIEKKVSDMASLSVALGRCSVSRTTSQAVRG